MSGKSYIGVNDISRGVKSCYVGIDGIARKVKRAYVGVDGIARLCYAGEQVSTFWGYLNAGGTAATDYCNTVFGNTTPATDAEKDTAYQNYVSTLPSSTCTGSSFFLYPKPVSFTGSVNATCDLLVPFSGSFSTNSSYVSGYIDIVTSSVSAPCNGRYKSILSVVSPSTTQLKNYVANSSYASNGSVFTISSGTALTNSNPFNISGKAGKWVDFRVTYGWEVTPTDSTYYINNYTPSSRPAGIVNNCTIASSDGQGNTTSYNLTAPIFNETTNAFINPATNTSKAITAWNYNYSTRTYNLTHADGTATVTYGDDVITVVDGDNTYIYNYMA